MLRALLADIEREQAGQVVVNVLDDGSEFQFVPPEVSYPILYRRVQHHGIHRFWELTSHELQRAKGMQWDRLVCLPDDVRLVPGFFDELERIWRLIPDKRKILLNPMILDQQRGVSNWTAVKPKALFLDCCTKVWKSQWVDGCFYSERDLGEVLGWRINQTGPTSGRVSSGVGRLMSRILHEFQFGLYQVDKSLVMHGDHPSVMHPQVRDKRPLTTS